MSIMPKITSYPTSTPVSVADMRTHLQLFGDTSYDGELENMLLAAQALVSDYMGQAVSATTAQIHFSDFGTDIYIPHKNSSNIAVKYYDSTNTLVTMTPNTDYVVDSTGAQVKIKIKNKPAEVSQDYENPGLIEYEFGMSTVPDQIRHAILIAAAEMFETRTESNTGLKPAMVTIERLLQSNKRWSW